MKEHKVGDRFTLSVDGIDVVLEVVPHVGCEGCFFVDVHDDCQIDEKQLGSEVDYCDRRGRNDETSVIFVEVKQ